MPKKKATSSKKKTAGSSKKRSAPDSDGSGQPRGSGRQPRRSIVGGGEGGEGASCQHPDGEKENDSQAANTGAPPAAASASFSFGAAQQKPAAEAEGGAAADAAAATIKVKVRTGAVMGEGQGIVSSGKTITVIGEIDVPFVKLEDAAKSGDAAEELLQLFKDLIKNGLSALSEELVVTKEAVVFLAPRKGQYKLDPLRESAQIHAMLEMVKGAPAADDDDEPADDAGGAAADPAAAAADGAGPGCRGSGCG
eukprot:COSAG04_NODE_5843_length_1477_cov_1.910015_2_plen_252_part_00